MFKNRLNFFFKNIVFSQNDVVLYNSNFLKNEYFLFCKNSYIKYMYLYFNSTLVDIVFVDNYSFYFLNKNKKISYFVKLYLYNIDVFLNIIGDGSKLKLFYNNFNWISRECLEFFGYYGLESSDYRNLLTNYSSKVFFLLKSNKLTGISDFKSLRKTISVFKKNSVTL